MFVPDSYELINLYKMYDLDVGLEIIEAPIVVAKEEDGAQAQKEDVNTTTDTKATQEGEEKLLVEDDIAKQAPEVANSLVSS